jgi:membrane-associated protease RseP (regulator of RpoE activity)
MMRDLSYTIYMIEHLSILYSIFYLTLVFIIHEGGHYIACRLFKAPPRAFSIGMGPVLYEFQDKRQTYWRLSILPIGAYVEPDEMKPLTRLQMIIVAFAGPFANFLSALVAFVTLLHFYPVILNNISLDQIAIFIDTNNLQIHVLAVFFKHITFHNDPCIVQYYCSHSEILGLFKTLYYTHINNIYNLFASLVAGHAGNLSNLQGAVGIIRSLNQAQSFVQLLLMLIQLSISFSLMNLLPIPGLDGYHILSNAFNVQNSDSPSMYYIEYFCFSLLILLMIGLIIKDVWKLFV